MKRFFVILAMILVSQASWGQGEWGMELGKSFSTFRFEDAQGNKGSQYRFAGGDRMGISYGKEMGDKGRWKAELGYREGGARLFLGTDLVEWRLGYAEAILRYEWTVDLGEHASMRLGLGPYVGFRILGDQRIGNQAFNLMDSEALLGVDWGLNLKYGIYKKVGNGMQLGVHYAFIGGLQNLENQVVNPGQKSYLRAHTFGIGWLYTGNQRSGK
jgi:hypothetical protein